ncbi:MAG TPA: hypothetical protein VEB43_06245 [Anaeromyxobacter sp.]|nr:hypothetical protein [Anaeromyxobacter sp.]
MNLRHALIGLLVAPVLTRGAPAAVAQPGTPPQVTTIAPASRPGPAVRMTPDAASQIPDAKKVQLAEESVETIRKTVDRVAGRSDEARRERDVGKLNCLNAQLTQMRGLAKVATQASEALVDAVGKKDAATANTQFARVVIAADKVTRMSGEADVCLGQLVFLMDGRTSVEVEQPQGLPGRDVTQRDPPPKPLATPPVVRPLAASRYY